MPLDPRTTLTRRLIALTLIVRAAAGLMWSVLCMAFGTKSRLALTPPIARRLKANASSRGNRLAAADSMRKLQLWRRSVEEIDEPAKTGETLTHIFASLNNVSDPSALTDTVADASAARVSTGLQYLPSEILGGLSQAQAQQLHKARAYADMETLETFAPAPWGKSQNFSAIVKRDYPLASQHRVIFVRAGDTVQQALNELGMTAHEARQISLLFALPSPDSGLALDDFIVLTVDEPARQPFMPSAILLQRKGSPAQTVALTDDGQYVRIVASRGEDDQASHNFDEDDRPALGHLNTRSLRQSLDALVQRHLIDHTLTDRLVWLCDHDVDLDIPATRDASVELLYVKGKPNDVELVYAAVTSGGQTHRYYRFTPPDDHVDGYYNSDGHAVSQFLLRKPVPSGQLGDGFGWRTHPILQDRRFHYGADYAAPFGLPIVAAGAGVFEKIEQQWGYGKYIRIRHDFGYETTYAHISGVPQGLHTGARVHQGQTIAYVGSTGLSTGPHLYYEVRINGQDVDPLRVRLRAGRILDGAILAAFSEAKFRTNVLLQESSPPHF